ncbi:VWA domain-containing protein [Myroides sp. N17-2]|uniref:VWA domain-containing protein n=1 Tax=Myroides sp. N17-2 TaxID=2030799 RepID=UPI000EFB3431|nr:VWA domain-containing protein [Myroides sp. N17-2]
MRKILLYTVLAGVLLTSCGQKREAEDRLDMSTAETTADVSEESTDTETWKKSSIDENAMRIQVGDEDFLPLEDAQVAVQVDGSRVRVLIDAYFYNDKGNGLEGTFKLKLPADAVPYYFAFGEATMLDSDRGRRSAKDIDSATLFNYNTDNFDLSYETLPTRRDQHNTREAKIVEKETASEAYYGTRVRKVDPALMEWSGADMFNCRIYPLQQDRLHHVVVGYDISMVEATTFREFGLQLPVVNNQMRVDLALANDKLYTISDRDKATIAHKNNKQYLTYHNPSIKAINIKLNTIEPIALVQKDNEGEYIAGTMRVSLPKVENTDIAPDVVFMLDTSLSSNPQLFGIWVNLMTEVLEKNEDVIKRFSVLNFNIGTTWYKEEYTTNTKANRAALKTYLDNLALEGATDLGRALKEASTPRWLAATSTPKNILLLSDGDLNWGNESKDALLSNIKSGDRVYTFKTGIAGANSEVLNYLSNKTGGSNFTANSGAQLVESAKALRYKTWNINSISGASVSDILIEGGVTDLYDGQILQFGARGDMSNPIVIKASSGKSMATIEFKPSYRVSSDLASRIYGKIAVGNLDQIGDALKSAVVNYSINFRIVSNYTSFLMLETPRDYENYGINKGSKAKDFVRDFTVSELRKEFLHANPFDAKKLFENWIATLQKQNILGKDDDMLKSYLESMTNEDFIIKPKDQKYKVWSKKQQTSAEGDALSDADVTFDVLYELANLRTHNKMDADALKLLSSIVEKNGGDTDVLRDLLTYTMNIGYGYDAYYLGQKVLKTREQDRLIYFNMARALEQTNPKLALIFYYIGTSNGFKRGDYGSIKAINGLFASNFIKQLETKNSNQSIKDKMFVKQLKTQVNDDYIYEFKGEIENDLVALVYWNVESTDLDLHVLESNREECSYRNRNTKQGGHISLDVRQGYGPEMYVLPKAKSGKYEIAINYFAQNDVKTRSVAKAYVEVYKYFGTSKQQVTKKTIILKERKEKEIVETIKF